MAIARVTSAGKAGADTAQTDAIDATGCTLIVGFVTGRGTGAMTDTLGSTFTGLTNRVSDAFGRFFYTIPSGIGSGYRVTGDTTGGSRCAVGWIGFSGTHASAPYDSHENGTVLFSSPGGPGSSGTPSEDNCLIITAIGGYFQYETSISTVTESGTSWTYDANSKVAYAGGVNFSAQLGYQIQTTATARTPIWTTTDNAFGDTPAVVAVFKSAAGGGGGGRTTKNTRSWPLGMAIGMNWRSGGDCSYPWR